MRLGLQALLQTSGNDPVAALDWLCLTVPEHELAQAFEPRRREQVGGGSGGSGGGGSSGGAPGPKRVPFGRCGHCHCGPCSSMRCMRPLHRPPVVAFFSRWCPRECFQMLRYYTCCAAAGPCPRRRRRRQVRVPC
jgi:hypothetical protein